MPYRTRTVCLGLALMILAVSLAASPQWKTVEGPDDLPEEFCTTWKKGDHLITFGRFFAILGGTARPMYSVLNYPQGNAVGCLLSVAPSGKGIHSDINLGSPNLRIRSKARPVVYSEVVPLTGMGRGSPGARASGSFVGQDGVNIRVATTYRFLPQPGRIDIVSVLSNAGTEPLENFSYSLAVGAATRYYFTPYHRDVRPNLNFRVYPRPDHILVWMNTMPAAPAPPPIEVLQPGESLEVRYAVFAESEPESLLNRIYRAAREQPVTTTLKWEDYTGGLVEVLVRETVTGSIFFRCFLKDQDSIRVPLLPGVYSAQVNFFPAVRQKLFRVRASLENEVILNEPKLGGVHVNIQDRKGRHVPGKVTFLGLDPTRSPYFEPENPILTGRGWESFKNSRFPGEDGEVVSLPPGTYAAYASRGPEYSIDHKIVEVLSDEDPIELNFQIDRVVNPRGLISLDPHLHTTYSDGAMGIRERIRSLVAEGLDVAVASDHNFITDYRPDLAGLGFEEHLAILLGNEVTVGGMVHYNTYPVAYRPQEPNHGAIDPISDSMAELFNRSRRKDPETLIQVNHPRSGTIGYFNMYELDPEKAAFALEGFETDFDVLEIVNGPYAHLSNRESIRDWFHLLKRGYVIPLVGSSDAHGIDRGEPGYSRTYVLYTGKKGPDLDVPALISALKQGRSFSSNGPLVDVTVNRKATFGDTITDKDGKVSLRIRIRRASWVKVDTLHISVNGDRQMEVPVKGRRDDWLEFLHKTTVTLTEDAFLVVEVTGKRSLYPVMQRVSRSGRVENATQTYAITNPVFVDVDGNGRFDPPWSDKIRLLPSIPKTDKLP